jgi:DMSO/TMAO reductase YedYZ molybdopterin-dependent catalytic subunit
MTRRHRFGRRHFMRTAGTLSAAWLLPRHVWSQESTIAGKEDLIVLSDRPINAETPIALLDADATSNRHHFIRNNGLVPERATKGDLDGWTLTLDGEVDKPRRFALPDLQSSYPNVEAQLVLECGGNGRSGYRPPASGNQWKLGAVGCALYKGVRLKDVLEDAGVKSSAVYVAYRGEDRHLSGDPNASPISRGVPIAKAMDENTLLAWEMNGQALPTQHGFPLRLIAPGYPASVSGKWLTRIWVRDRVHDGPKMGGYSYRVPRYPVAPGTDVPEDDMEIIEAMPVKSVITRPASGIDHPLARPLALRGHAWCGDGAVSAMHVSMDFGSTWTAAELERPRNPFAWQHWSAELRFPKKGHYEIWARATDHARRSQPMVVPGWNPRGYLNNAMHRIAVRVA